MIDSRLIIIYGFSANTDVLLKTLQEVKKLAVGKKQLANCRRGFSEA
jgi:hypothetical protein